MNTNRTPPNPPTPPFPPESEGLDAILDAFAAAVPDPPAYADLAPWVERYPQYAREISEYAAVWALDAVFDPTPDPASLPAPDARQIAQDVRRIAALRESLTPISSLVGEARAQGIEPRGLAGKTRISMTILAKLERRVIRAASVPDVLVRDLAMMLGRSAATVRAYLEGAATLPAGASFRATHTPTVGEAEDFFAAVASDRTLDAHNRDHWLALAPDATDTRGDAP